MVLGRTLAPKTIRVFKEKGGIEEVYSNLNLAWEVWKDVKLPMISKYESTIFFLFFYQKLRNFNRKSLPGLCIPAFCDLERGEFPILFDFERTFESNQQITYKKWINKKPIKIRMNFSNNMS